MYNRGKYYIICIVYNIRPRLSSIRNITQIHLHYIYISFFQVHKIKYIELNSTPLATNPIIITSTPVIWNPIRKYHPLRTSYILQREIEYCTVVSHDSYMYIYIYTLYLQLRIDSRGHLFGLLVVFLWTLCAFVLISVPAFTHYALRQFCDGTELQLNMAYTRL